LPDADTDPPIPSRLIIVVTTSPRHDAAIPPRHTTTLVDDFTAIIELFELMPDATRR